MSKYTKGPWEVKDNRVFKADFPTFRIAICTSNVADYWEEVANAHLIASAPDLLKALILILPLAKGYVAHNQVGSNEKYLQIAEQAKAKAEELI